MNPRPAKILAALAMTLFMVATPAEANSISFSGATPSGMVTVPFTVSSTALVNFNWNGGNGDAIFGLFDSTGVHIITADDFSGSGDPKLARTLGPGSYFLLASYFSPVTIDYLLAQGAVLAFSDGPLSPGFFYPGGTATITGVQTSINNEPINFKPSTFEYDFTIDAGDLNVLEASVAPVPEPGTFLLLGAGVAGIATILRRRRAA